MTKDYAVSMREHLAAGGAGLKVRGSFSRAKGALLQDDMGEVS